MSDLSIPGGDTTLDEAAAVLDEAIEAGAAKIRTTYGLDEVDGRGYIPGGVYPIEIAELAVTAAGEVFTARHAAEVEAARADAWELGYGERGKRALLDQAAAEQHGPGRAATPEVLAAAVTKAMRWRPTHLAEDDLRWRVERMIRDAAPILIAHGREQAARAILAMEPFDKDGDDLVPRTAAARLARAATPTPAGGEAESRPPSLKQSTYYSDLRKTNPQEFTRIFGDFPAPAGTRPGRNRSPHPPGPIEMHDADCPESSACENRECECWCHGEPAPESEESPRG